MGIAMASRWLLATVVAAATVVLPVAASSAAVAPPGKTSGQPRETLPGAAPSLRVATYNVCKVTCGSGPLSWSNRRTKVANIIATLNADVTAVQETPTLKYGNTTQWADMADLLRARGLRIASMKDGCSSGCTRGSHLYYDPNTVDIIGGIVGPTFDPPPPQQCMKYWEQRDNLRPRHRDPWYDDWFNLGCRKWMSWEPTENLSAGMVSMQKVSGISWGGIQDRNISWAFMRQKATGKTFIALSLQTPNEKTAQGERIRKALATKLPTWVASFTSSLGYPNIPVIIAGDWNSYQARQPNGAQTILAKSGYTDAFDAKDKVNARYATINKNGKINRRFKGWPPKPYQYNRPGTRIDYVFGKGVSPVRYELFIRTTGSGAFDERYRASDHNPVVTDWQFPSGAKSAKN